MVDVHYTIVSLVRPRGVVEGEGCLLELFVAGGFNAKPVNTVIVTMICLQVNNLVGKTLINWACLWCHCIVGK